MKKYTLPSKTIKEIKPKPANATKFKAFIRWSERLYCLLFFLVEMFIGACALAVFIYWAFKIFYLRDGSYVMDARRAFEHIHNNWIGYLFILPFIFFRIIVVKAMTMRAWGDSKFDGAAGFISYRD